MPLKFFRIVVTGFRPGIPGVSTNSAVFALLAACAGASTAQTSFDLEFDDQNKPWAEIELRLPPAPAMDKLLPFYVSATSTQAFALDPASLAIGADGVIRYTIVATSAAGARNVSYEGIRCKSYEKKVYAFGHSDGTWKRSRRDQWEPIRNSMANRQHASLAQDYFCDGETIVGKANYILDRMRNASVR